MSDQPSPVQDLEVFNALSFLTSGASYKIGQDKLQFPIAQGTETVRNGIIHGDATFQRSAYTGAAHLSGSYTSANITIDINGRITSISSGGGGTVNNPMTTDLDGGGYDILNVDTIGAQNFVAAILNSTIKVGHPVDGPIFVDTANRRVGINVPNPTEDFEIDGNIQLDTGGTSKIVFYDSPNAHEHGEIDAGGDGTNGGILKFQTKVDGGSVTEKLRINNAGAIGLGGAVYGGTNQVIVSQGSTLPPRWRNNYPNIVSGFPVPPSANLYGDQILFNFTGAGNIGAYVPMIWNGATWKVTGSTTLCRWFCGSASQIINSTTPTNITIGDYGSITFTPPFTGYYEIGQNWFKWELNSGIGMSTYFYATDGSEYYRLFYTEDWNGPYQHWRGGVSCPFVALLQSTKTYRFTANLSYAAGNQGTLLASGNTAYVKALSST